MMATERPEDTIAANIVRKLRALRAAVDRERQTTLAREIAEGSVALREFYTDVNGQPDYAGRTHAYRVTMRDLWSKAGFVDAEERDAAQARVRYHVGNIVRERIPAETLEAAGLQGPSPREQTTERKRAVAALAQAASSGPLGDTDADLVRAVGAALAILLRIDVDRVAAIAGREAQLVKATLNRIAGRASVLSAAADAGESPA